MGETDDKDDFINQLKNELNSSQGKVTELSSAMVGMNSASRDGNFLQYQIDSAELLERLHNFYRGRYVAVDKEGNIGWKEPKDKEAKTFNSLGVNMLMATVTKYIDRNTTLSNYTEMRINQILSDLGNELILVILCNQEKMGMDTHYKKTQFRVTIVTTLHMIESAYRKAIGGKTMEEINQSKIVTQNDHINVPNNIPRASKPGFSNLFGLLK